MAKDLDLLTLFTINVLLAKRKQAVKKMDLRDEEMHAALDEIYYMKRKIQSLIDNQVGQ